MEDSLRLLDFDQVLARAGGAQDLALSMISLGCVDIRKRETELVSALERPEPDWAAARDAVHGLRGLAGLAGLSRLGAVSTEWELALSQGRLPEPPLDLKAFRELIAASVAAAQKAAKDS